MGWATKYIEQLEAGETVSFRPHGQSMSGKIESGQLVEVAPITSETNLEVGDIVLCKVAGGQYLHLIKAVHNKSNTTEYQIGNNHGFINGWTDHKNIYGKLISVKE